MMELDYLPYSSTAGLPSLQLDRIIPLHALNRRDAVSLSSGAFSSTPRPLTQRRGGISFDQADKNAVYIRSGAEVKVLTKPDLAREFHSPERSRSRSIKSPHDHSLTKLLDKLETSHYRTRCGLRFLSLHRVRRRPRPSLKCSREYSSLLDAQYVGHASRLLSTIGEWDFNMFTLNKLTNGRALFHTALHLFQDHNLIEIFKLDIVKLMRFISLVEEGYHSSNPYHNAVHAADVGQAMHCYLKEHKMCEALSPLEKLTAIVSAITHDLDHPGVNQAFLIATSNHLAGLYNNLSVLENHHWRSAVGLLHESGVFAHFDDSLWKAMEWQLKSLILATDITRQKEFLLRLKTQLDQNTLKLDNVEHRNFVLQIALKCADISNPGRPWEHSKRWSELVCDEFFKQGDCERQFNLPVTPFCDRYSTTVAKIQSGFMNFVVMPLFEEWYRFNPTKLAQTMLTNIKINATNWDRIILETEAQKLKQDQGILQEEEEDVDQEEEEEQQELSSITNQQTTVVVIEQGQDHDKENSEPVPSMPSGDADAKDPENEEDIIPMCLYRRHSLPPPLIANRDSLFSPIRRESIPRNISRRYSLPVGDLPNSNSFDKLVEKLSSLVESSPTNGTQFDYDQRPQMVSVSQSLDAKTLSSAALEGSKLTSAHGLDPILLAQRPYTSEPHIAMLAHQCKLNNRLGNLAYLAKNLSVAGVLPRFQHCKSMEDSLRPKSTSRYSHPTQNRLLDSKPGSKVQMTLIPAKHCSSKTHGHMLSLGDTANVMSDKDHIVATHSENSTCQSGSQSADKTDASPNQSQSAQSINNHIPSHSESPNQPPMTTGRHCTREEEVPLLDPLSGHHLEDSPECNNPSHSNHSCSQ